MYIICSAYCCSHDRGTCTLYSLLQPVLIVYTHTAYYAVNALLYFQILRSGWFHILCFRILIWFILSSLFVLSIRYNINYWLLYQFGKCTKSTFNKQVNERVQFTKWPSMPVYVPTRWLAVFAWPLNSNWQHATMLSYGGKPLHQWLLVVE